MDLLDIVFRLERRFDIKITREELFQAFPGASEREFQARRLLDLVISKLPGEVAEGGMPADQGVEPGVLDAARDWLQMQFPSLKPGDVLPQFTRKQWRAFDLQGVRPPPLGYGNWHVIARIWQLLCGLALVSVYIVLRPEIARMFHGWEWASGGFTWFATVGLVIVLVALFFGGVIFGWWALGTQPEASTMDELARQLAEFNVRFFAKRAGRQLSRDQVWKLIRRELSDALGIDEEVIHPESDLVKDLGAE